MEITSNNFYSLGNLNSIYTLSDIDLNNDITQVAFLFERKLLLIELNENDDTIKVNLYKKKFSKLEGMKRNKLIEKYFLEVSKYQCIWIWFLTNQQGYKDGLQLEFLIDNNHLSNDVTIQFIVVASRFKISLVTPLTSFKT